MTHISIKPTTPGALSLSATRSQISLRKFPYPYKAALAICSDIDETQTTGEFLEIQRFLNTKDETSMGEGLGLEIGNSFYFYDDEAHFSYFTHDERARRVIVDLIQAGYIDCLHSYGDAATSRDEILRALEALQKAGCKLEVWVNHYGSRSNISRKFEYMFIRCQGDDPASEVYHADVTLAYGIRFMWVGSTTRVIGQALSGKSANLSTLVDAQNLLSSGVSILKEIRKKFLGKWGDERYPLHYRNQLAGILQLQDGQRVHEFMRYCNHPVNISLGATSRGLAYTISNRALNHLKAVQGFMIVYTHLGKNSDCGQAIAPETQAALRHLACEYLEGEIYVTTTAKLLNYYNAHQYLVWSSQQSGELIQIRIKYLDDPIFGRQYPTVSQLQGLTFYVPDRNKVELYLQEKQVNPLQRNSADETGQESVTIPLTRLSFPTIF